MPNTAETPANNEKTYVEEPFLEHLKAAGWTIARWDRSGGLGRRADMGDCILEDKVKDALRALNPWLKKEQVDDLCADLRKFGGFSLLERNREGGERIANGLRAYDESTGEDNKVVRLVDFRSIGAG